MTIIRQQNIAILSLRNMFIMRVQQYG